MKIIFLDIDGVLNNQNYFIQNHKRILDFYAKHEEDRYKNDFDLHVDRLMMDIDIEKLNILKEIVNDTDAKIVVVSSWKSFRTFDEIARRLIKDGLPIIGKTDDGAYDRGYGIYQYLNEHDVNNYIILDDEIFPDYDENLLNHLVKTSFYEEGLTEKHAEKAKIMLKKGINR